MHHPQITSPTKRWIYKLRSKKPRNHPGVENYSHVKIVHYAMIQHLVRKGLNQFNKVGDAAVEK